jgi:hypothetical protein
MPINPIHPYARTGPFCADMIVGTQIDGHLDLVTATLARPYMTDFMVARVCRRRWRHQQVIAFAARHSRGARLSAFEPELASVAKLVGDFPWMVRAPAQESHRGAVASRMSLG